MATVAPITPPVEATLRILLNSVPYLMGAAVVRQPPGEDGIVASVGRMPWLHDKRLVTLELPEDTLPANRAVALDWPVPFQAEWVGAPPRLLISRLVFQGRTVGVLLGTHVTRERIDQSTREALDLSCEVIASAVAAEAVMLMAAHSVHAPAAPPAPQPEPSAPRAEPAAVVDPPLPDAGPTVEAPPAPRTEPTATASASTREPPPSPPQASPADVAIEQVRRGAEMAEDARSLGRVMRDALNVVTDASAFAVALYATARPEVAYRYKVVGSDPDSAQLGRQHVEDGPQSASATGDRRWNVYTREIAIGDGEPRTRPVVVVQLPMTNGGEVFGMVSVQTFRARGFTEQELRTIATIVDACAPRFAQVRAAGRFQPASAPPPTPIEPAPAGVLPQASAVPTATPARRTPEDVLRDLLRRCAGAGFPSAFLLGVDPDGRTLRGELVSEGAAALDRALGITNGALAIPLDDMGNAAARAMRERRTVPAPSLFDIARPALSVERTREIEAGVAGARSVVFALVVKDRAAGVLVLGPMTDDPSFFAIEEVRGFIDDAAKELAALLA